MIDDEIRQYRIWTKTQTGTPKLHNNRFEPSQYTTANITDDRALYIDSVLCRFSKLERKIYLYYYETGEDFTKVLKAFTTSIDDVIAIRDKIDRAING